jgi:hypothetical protein
MKTNIAAHELSAIMPGQEAEEQPKKIVAILWPKQPSIPINGHNFLCFRTNPARLLARAK